MYRPPSRKKQLIRRAIVYSAMSITVVGLVFILVLVMLGYRFDQSEGHIEQGGLVQFDTVPDGAQVTVDGISLSSQTPTKTTLSTGRHAVAMQKDGYRKWQKTITLEAGSVLWLKYARLIPTGLKTENVAKFSVVSDTLASPSKKWMAIKEEADAPEFKLASLGGKEIKPIAIPKNAYTSPDEGKSHSFAFASWDSSSKYLLVKHTFNDGQYEWLLVDTAAPSETKNLTVGLGETMDQPIFSNDSQTLYARVDGAIRRINAEAMTLSGPLARNVTSFTLSSDDVLVYVAQPDGENGTWSVGYISKGTSTSKILRTYKKDAVSSLHATLSTYFGDTYVALTHDATFELYEGNLPYSEDSENPSLDRIATQKLADSVIKNMATHTDDRFIIIRHGTSFTVYDLELKKQTTTKIQGGDSAEDGFGWLDGYMLWSDMNGKITLYEFDGANQHELMPVVAGTDVTLSSDERYLYGITRLNDAFHLTRVMMIL